MASVSIAQWALGFASHSIDPDMYEDNTEVTTAKQCTINANEAAAPLFDWPNDMGVCGACVKLAYRELTDGSLV